MSNEPEADDRAGKRLPKGGGAGPITVPAMAERQHASRHKLAVVLGSAFLSLVMSLPFLNRAPIYRDEAASLSAAGRSWSQLFELLHHLDIVHGAYYALLHVWLLPSDALWWARLPSALAIAGAVAVTADLGLRYGGTQCGTLAGLIAAFSAHTAATAILARSYGIDALAVVSLLLAYLRVLERPKTNRLLVAVLLAFLAPILHLFAGGLPALAVAAAFVGAGGRKKFQLTFPPLIAALFSFGATALLSQSQSSAQIGYLRAPGPSAPIFTAQYLFGSFIAASIVGAAMMLGLIVTRALPRTHIVPLVTWLVLPPLALMVISYLNQPVYSDIYLGTLVFPAALLAAVGLSKFAAAARSRAKSVAVAMASAVLLVSLAVPAWRTVSAPYQTDDPRSVTQAMLSNFQSGDAVVFVGALARVQFDETLGDRSNQFLDALLVGSPSSTGTFTGTEKQFSAANLQQYPRVWLVENLSGGMSRATKDDLLALTSSRTPCVTVRSGQFQATLYSR